MGSGTGCRADLPLLFHLRAGAFNGAVLKLVAAKAPIRAVVGPYGVDAETWSGFYVAEDSPIRAPRDLICKKVAMNTLGAHHEFVLREYLSRAGLSVEQIAQVMLVVIPPVNGEQALRQHQTDVTVPGGSFATALWNVEGYVCFSRITSCSDPLLREAA